MERDRLWIRPLVVTETADHPFRALLELLDLHDPVGDKLGTCDRDGLADLRNRDQLLRQSNRNHAGRDVRMDRLGQVEQP